MTISETLSISDRLSLRASKKRERPDESLVSFFAPASFEAEQYRGLRHMVEESGKRVVGITSPTPGDGKTTTAINLAGALAQAPGIRVLLVEADLRQPHIGGVLRVEDSLSALDPTKVLGLVFNRDDRFRRGYYGYGYYTSEPKGRRMPVG